MTIGNCGDAPGNEMAVRLKADIVYLSDTLGPRNMENYGSYGKAAEWLEKSFADIGYSPFVQSYSVSRPFPAGVSGFGSMLHYSCGEKFSSWPGRDKHRSRVYKNIIAELRGTVKPEEVIVVGAHYDTAPVEGCGGADDNASGIASVLELARSFSGGKFERTIRFAAFANEEPPFFQTNGMGAYVYARESSRKKEKITAMISMESIGYFSDEKGSQKYPPGIGYFYPDKGNFIAVIGNFASASLVKQSVRLFKENADVPVEGACLPELVPGIGWSDHWAFWKYGYKAIMITDTAPFRNPCYHKRGDSADKLDYEKMSAVVKAAGKIIENLAVKTE